jgi:sugar phosphate isomerase/epimerase
MNKTRRQFLQNAGMITAGGLLLPTWACQSTTDGNRADNMGDPSLKDVSGSIEKFGIQLYTLRDDMPKDPKGVLKQIASFGYHQIEGYEGDQGMFWGMSHTDCKAYMDELGLDFVASHCDINQDFETKAAQAGEIGMQYLICPWVGPQKSLDDYKRLADQFNECGEICQKNGLRFAYHNHDYSFKEQEGEIPQDYMMANTDPATVDYELDLYWVIVAGADPIAYFEKYPGRFSLCHVKDRMKDVPATETDASCDLGTGSIDYSKILKAAAANGMQYYIVEQERYDGSTPLKSAEADAEYLRNLVFS